MSIGGGSGGHSGGGDNGGHSGASHGGSSHADGSKGGRSKGSKGGTQVAQNHNVKTGVGIGAGTVDVLGNAHKASQLPSNNPGFKNGYIGKGLKAAEEAGKAAIAPVAKHQAKKALDDANTRLGQAKAGGLAKRGPR
ncbi:hypothetical protein D3C80_612980 [compost metagenome]